MTSYQRILSIICLAAGIILAVLASWWISGNRSYRKGWNDAMASVVPDTVWHTDTVAYEVPVEVEKWKDKIVYVPVTQTDTIHQHDTTYIALQFEKKEYADTTYRAIVSGYCPSLDYIEVYQKTAYITEVVIEKALPEFILSPAVKTHFAPGAVSLVAGLEFDSWTKNFQFYGGAGYGYHHNAGEWKEGWYVSVGVKYNLIKK